MDNEKIRQAFTKAKQDILSLHLEISTIKQEIQELKALIKQQSDRQTDNPAHSPTQNQAQKAEITAIQHINPAQTLNTTHFPTHNLPLEAVKSQNSNISTGNEGVPTDKQTNQQTDTSTRNNGVKVRLNLISKEIRGSKYPYEIPTTQQNSPKENKIEHLEKVADFISSLDGLKKELRQKFKKLTKQEMLVFTTVYQLEEEGFIVDYSLIAKKLSLTESSIRDYIQRTIKKGIPISKTKENNKKVLLSISPELKKIASLTTIIQLREI